MANTHSANKFRNKMQQVCKILDGHYRESAEKQEFKVETRSVTLPCYYEGCSQSSYYCHEGT